MHRGGEPMNFKGKNLLLWGVLGLSIIILALNLFTMPTKAMDERVIFSDFMAKLDNGDFEKVIIKGNHISGVLRDNTLLRSYSAEYPDLVKVLREKDVQIEVKPPDESPWYMTFLVAWGPFIFFLGLWLFLMRQMQLGGNQALVLREEPCPHDGRGKEKDDLCRRSGGRRGKRRSVGNC